MSEEEKIQKFIEALGVQQSKWQSESMYHRSHNFKKEAEYIETKLKVLKEIKSEMEAVFTSQTRKDGYPQFMFD